MLVKENESLKSGGVTDELERLRKHSEERSKMLEDVSEKYHTERKERRHSEARFEDANERLKRAEEVNTALIEHVRTHVPRLRSSRKEHAKQAAEQVRTELVGQAQSSLDRARKYCAEQVEYARLNSMASQVKTQLDMISAYGIEVDSEEVEARFDDYQKQIEAMPLMDFSEGDYKFVPRENILPGSYEEDIAKSPLGEDFGIERGWILEPFEGEWAGEKDRTESADDRGGGAQGNDQIPGSEQDVEGLMDVMADRVLGEPATADQALAEALATDPRLGVPGVVGRSEARDPETGEDLMTLFAPPPSTSVPSDQRPE